MKIEKRVRLLIALGTVAGAVPAHAAYIVERGAGAAKRTVTWWVCAFLSLVLTLGVAHAQTTSSGKRYPPYPEVWGYEFPFFSADQRQVNRRHVIWRYWRTPTGDIKVSYWLPDNLRPEDKGAQGQEGKLLGELHFFSGARRFLSGPEADEERKRPSRDRDITSTNIEKITFSDGSAVRVKVVFDQAFDGKCFTSHPHSIQRLDRNGHVVAWKSIVYVHDRPLRRISHQICNGGEANVALERSVTDDLELIPLDDETFLVKFLLGHYVLRFDKELRTKYSPSARLFIVDTAVINGIRAKHEALAWPLNEQTINDEVTNYVLQLPRGKTK